MASGLQFDDEMARRVEALYKTDDAVRRRRTVLEALQLRAGERVLDIGTGPGFVAYEMADRVGQTGEIFGIDISEPMLQLARKRCAEKPWVQFREGNATQLPAPDAEFDAAVSVQVYEYIRELDVALAELYCVLRPGGRAAVVSTDWKSIVWNAGDEVRMQRVLSAFAEHCAYVDLPRMLGPKLSAAGFSISHWQVIPQFNTDYDPNAYSYHLIGLIRSFVPGRQGVSATEASEWAEDLQQQAGRGDYFFSLNQYLCMAIKPESAG